MQLFDLQKDPAETTNVVADFPGKVEELLLLMDQQVEQGRCTPGKALANDRTVTFLPEGVTLPERR
jgi:arylsulfatase A